MVTCTKYTTSVTLGDPETAAPPSSTAADDGEHYISVTVNCLLSFQPTWTETPIDLPPVSKRKTFLVTRRRFFADAPASMAGVLDAMNLLLPEGRVGELARRGSEISRAAVAQNPSARVIPLEVSLSGVKLLRSSSAAEQLMVEIAAARSPETPREPVPAAESSIEVLEYAIGGTRSDQEQCPICWEELNHEDDDNRDEDRRVVRTPCSHVYHKNCIVQWLKENNKCPLCRYSMATN